MQFFCHRNRMKKLKNNSTKFYQDNITIPKIKENKKNNYINRINSITFAEAVTFSDIKSEMILNVNLTKEVQGTPGITNDENNRSCEDVLFQLQEDDSCMDQNILSILKKDRAR